MYSVYSASSRRVEEVSLVVCKIADAMQNSASSTMLKIDSEAHMYGTVHHLQGVVISRGVGNFAPPRS